MEFTAEQKDYMRRALLLAEKARGFTEPNPLVGAVIVKDGAIVGEGYHHKAGEPHAEINAISAARNKTRGASMYVTLEPCAHYGKTPPCANAVVRAGIKEVFIALEDPNPKVDGRGIRILEEAGIAVHTGLMRREAIAQNRVFLTNQIKKRAFVALKSAQTIDGRIGPADGRPLIITGEEARRRGHFLRRDCGAVLIGVRTALKDDPSLNIRYDIDHPPDRPVRIVIDPQMRLPLTGKIWNGTKEPVLIYTLSDVSSSLRRKIEGMGGSIVSLPHENGVIDPLRLTVDLLERGICGVLVEGGAHTLTRFLEAGVWDEYHCFVAPKFLGTDGINVFDRPLKETLALNVSVSSELCGEDLHITYKNHSGVESCLPESLRKRDPSAESGVIHLVRR